MKKNMLSVIIPAYNVEQYINECVDSVLNEGYPDIEVLIVNDGSSDHTREFLKKYEQHPQIVIIDKINGGLSDARNAGLKQVSGEYVTFVDGDDAVLPGTFSINMKKLSSDKNVCLLQYPIRYFWKTTRSYTDNYPEKTISDKKEIISTYLSEQITNSACDKIFKMSMFDNLEFSDIVHEDMFIMPDLIRKTDRTILTNDGEYLYRYRENSIVNARPSLKRTIGYIKARCKAFELSDIYPLDQLYRQKKLIALYRKISSDFGKFTSDEQHIICLALNETVLNYQNILFNFISGRISFRKFIILHHHSKGGAKLVFSKIKIKL